MRRAACETSHRLPTLLRLALGVGLVLAGCATLCALAVDAMSEHASDCECLRCSAERERKAAEGHFIANTHCPKCGAQLLGNAHGDEWCSMVGCGYWLSGDAPRTSV